MVGFWLELFAIGVRLVADWRWLIAGYAIQQSATTSQQPGVHPIGELLFSKTRIGHNSIGL
jgi:hypothetical protein